MLWLSEHGRTPQIDSKPKGAGRHHWSRAYSVALAGGGVARGKVVGSTDKIGGDVTRHAGLAEGHPGDAPSTCWASTRTRRSPTAGPARADRGGDGQVRTELLG